MFKATCLTIFPIDFTCFIRLLISSSEFSYLREQYNSEVNMNDSPSILLKNGSLIVHDDNDNVVIKYNSDILIEEGIISRIGKGIEAKEGVLVIECSGKIISPGFIDTHHHVWQMQLKGRHSDDTLVEYHPKGHQGILKDYIVVC